MSDQPGFSRREAAAAFPALLAAVSGLGIRGTQPPGPLTAPSDGIRNVRDFGAKGDGKTDDGPAIQAAIDSIPTQSGGIVFVPGVQASWYLSARTLEFGPRNIRLVGVGGGSSRIRFKDTERALRVTNDQCSIESVTLEGPDSVKDGI